MMKTMASFSALLLSTLFSLSNGLDASGSCSDMKNFYAMKGSNFEGIVLNKPSLATGMNVCHGVYTCCSSEAENMLIAQSMQDVQAVVSNKSENLAKMFFQKHKEVDKFFKNLIEESRTSLHTLFSDTYGFLYTENANVFMKFFDDLKLYYQGGIVDLTDIFEGFFTTLMQKIFALLNPSYDISDEYMECISDNMNAIKPFNEIPKKLSNQVQRSFIAARTFVEALKTGHRVATSMHSEQSAWRLLPKTGVVDYTKMAYCSKCNGHVEMKPCKNTCHTAMEECLCGLKEGIDTAWAKYMNGMGAVLDRLLGPFDVEAVLSPTDIKISEAVMMLQENRISITDAVKRQCGELPRSSSTSDGGITPLNGFQPSSKPLGGFSLEGLSNYNPTEGETNPLSSLNLDGLKNINFEDFDFGADDSGSKISKRSAGQSPKEKRRRRRKSRKRSHHGTREITSSNMRKGEVVPQPEDTGIHFKDLLKDFKSGLKDLRHFWRNLPENICDTIAEATPGKDCWDGTTVTKFTPELEVSKPDLCENVANTEDAIVKQQIVILREMTSTLWLAHRGIDPAFMDGEVPADVDSSGEGSGEDEESVIVDEDKKLDTGSKSRTNEKKKSVKDLEDWQISLIEQALGRSVDSKSSLHHIKTQLNKHPDLKPKGTKSLETDTNEKFGDLSPEQQKQLKKILGMHHDHQKDTEKQNNGEKPNNNVKHVVTQPPKNLDTTSAASTSRQYSSLVFIFAIFLNFFFM